MYKIDIKDKRILSELDMNARMPLTKLSKKIGLSRQVIDYRIKKMKNNNIIFAALTICDSTVVGYYWYRVAFRLLNITKKQKSELITYLKNNEYILWLGEAGGNWDLVMNFTSTNNFKFNKIFESIITKFGSLIMDYHILIYLNVYDLERMYIMNKKSPRREFFHQMKYNPSIKLDKLDKSILKDLTNNAFIPYHELAVKNNVSANTISNRIKQLEKNKVILGYRLYINPRVFGYRWYMLFLEIKRLNIQREKSLYTYLKSIPNIAFLVKHIGKWRIGMEIETKDEQQFQEILVEIRGKFADLIADFEAFPLFKDHVINYFPPGNLK